MRTQSVALGTWLPTSALLVPRAATVGTLVSFLLDESAKAAGESESAAEKEAREHGVSSYRFYGSRSVLAHKDLPLGLHTRLDSLLPPLHAGRDERSLVLFAEAPA
eukprot:Plantae.Rhodophyta-Rhodochaete_pulchella.ctg2746.p3 GENE.Plantae.Rhodophyta-Rhodochaete_pulchella.ctg2746~~Plantae.Rhodophyta-Rhodochaete_pulchella.ctg2746.p3  ORF type:complete len:106 (-),score=15.20 Plantae.Rhodophyta-Rhodochaete_pulchella.ctg2746:907-1224(-)